MSTLTKQLLSDGHVWTTWQGKDANRKAGRAKAAYDPIKSALSMANLLWAEQGPFMINELTNMEARNSTMKAQNEIARQLEGVGFQSRKIWTVGGPTVIWFKR